MKRSTPAASSGNQGDIQTITPIGSSQGRFDPSRVPGGKKSRNDDDETMSMGSNGSRRSASSNGSRRSNDSRRSGRSNRSCNSSGSTGSKRSTGSKSKASNQRREEPKNVPRTGPLGIRHPQSRTGQGESQSNDRRLAGAAVAGAAGGGMFSFFSRFGNKSGSKAVDKAGYADMESGSFQKEAVQRFQADSYQQTPTQSKGYDTMNSAKTVDSGVPMAEKAPVTGASTQSPVRVAKIVAMSLGILSILVVIPAAGSLMGVKSSSNNFYTPFLEPESVSPSLTVTPSHTPSRTPTMSHSLSLSPTGTLSTSQTRSISRTPTQSPYPTGSPSQTISRSSQPTYSRTPSRTPSITPTPSPQESWFWWWPF